MALNRVANGTFVASTSFTASSQPTPSYILRGHTGQLSVLRFSKDARSLFAGDIDGFVGVWDLRTFRPRYFWKAHDAGLLDIVEWEGGLLTQARDNKLIYYPLPVVPPLSETISRSSATAIPSPKDPTSGIEKKWEMDINCMAYCRMSVLTLSEKVEGKGKAKATEIFGDNEALVAVPSLTKDEQIDIFHIPSQARVHRAIGTSLFPLGLKTGTLMAVNLFRSPSPGSELHLLAGYEDGRVALFRFTGSQEQAFAPPLPGTRQEEAEGWELVWDEKGHREALMSLTLSPDRKHAWSVAADHFICRYTLFSADEKGSHLVALETVAPGRSIIEIREDEKIIAVAGWDGEVRVYSARTGAPLAVLSYHRMSLHALAFAPVLGHQGILVEDESDSEDDEDEKPRAWLAAGGKDTRITLWEVYPP
ncbi:WD40 repeat-like protein [Meredithblackwellia eburnea MCA 4105]